MTYQTCWIFQDILSKKVYVCAKNAFYLNEIEMCMQGTFYIIKKNILLFFLILVLFSSCSYKNRRALLKSPNEIDFDTLKTVYVSNAKNADYSVYRIKVNDILSVRNLQNPGLIGGDSNGTISIKDNAFKVDPDGTVALPVIGKVLVIGLTRIEAANIIQKIYTEKLFKDPIIDVNIVNLKVTVLGEVGTQGNFILENENTDLIDMIGIVGGIRESGNDKKLRIVRGNRKDPEIIYVNLSNINSLSNPKLRLQEGDIILVDRLRFVNFTNKVTSVTNIVSIAVTLLNTYLILKKI